MIGSTGLSELWFGPGRTHFWALGLTKSVRESTGKLSHTSIVLPCAPEWGSLMIKGPLSKTSPSGDDGLDKANLWSHHCAQILIQNSTKTTLILENPFIHDFKQSYCPKHGIIPSEYNQTSILRWTHNIVSRLRISFVRAWVAIASNGKAKFIRACKTEINSSSVLLVHDTISIACTKLARIKRTPTNLSTVKLINSAEERGAPTSRDSSVGRTLRAYKEAHECISSATVQIYFEPPTPQESHISITKHPNINKRDILASWRLDQTIHFIGITVHMKIMVIVFLLLVV
jgi:hypothetical protein